MLAALKNPPSPPPARADKPLPPSHGYQTSRPITDRPTRASSRVPAGSLLIMGKEIKIKSGRYLSEGDHWLANRAFRDPAFWRRLRCRLFQVDAFQIGGRDLRQSVHNWSLYRGLCGGISEHCRRRNDGRNAGIDDDALRQFLSGMDSQEWPADLPNRWCCGASGHRRRKVGIQKKQQREQCSA